MNLDGYIGEGQLSLPRPERGKEILSPQCKQIQLGKDLGFSQPLERNISPGGDKTSYL